MSVLFNSLSIFGIWFSWESLCSITVLDCEMATLRVTPICVGTAFYCSIVHRFRNTTSSYFQVFLKSININTHAYIGVCAHAPMCLWRASGGCDNLPNNLQSLCSAAASCTLCCSSRVLGRSTRTPACFPKSFCLQRCVSDPSHSFSPFLTQTGHFLLRIKLWVCADVCGQNMKRTG